MSLRMKKSFAREMQNMEAASLLRLEVPAVEDSSMEVQIDSGSKALNFFSTDFLGWRYRDDIKEAAASALNRFGTGATSSRGTIGTLDILSELEASLCAFLGLESCIVMPSRYLANIGIFDALTNERDSIFIDEGCNDGLVDGVRFSKAKTVVHNFKDYANLEYQLKCSKSARYRIIVSDGIFNADGGCAGLEELQQLKQRYDAITVVDDSLGIGMLGNCGRGTCNHLGIENPNIISGTFAYALGNVAGGFIAGDGTLIEWLRQSSRSYLLSEPLSPVNAAVVLKAIDILQNDQSLIEALAFNAHYLREELKKARWEIVHTEHPTLTIIIGSTLAVQKMVEELFDKEGILVSGLCYPNAPEGSARIKIHLSAKHSTDQIDTLVAALGRVRYLIDKV